MEFTAAREREKKRQLARSLFSKGLEASDNSNPTQAASYYRQALTEDPQHVPALLNMGLIKFNEKDLKGAEAYYRKALEADPSNAHVYYSLATCLDHQGAKADAIKYYLKALSIQPNHADVHVNLASTYHEIGDFRKAIKHYRLYLKYGVGDEEIWLFKARSAIETLSQKELCVVASSGLALKSKSKLKQLTGAKLSLVPQQMITSLQK